MENLQACPCAAARRKDGGKCRALVGTCHLFLQYKSEHSIIKPTLSSTFNATLIRHRNPDSCGEWQITGPRLHRRRRGWKPQASSLNRPQQKLGNMSGPGSESVHLQSALWTKFAAFSCQKVHFCPITGIVNANSRMFGRLMRFDDAGGRPRPHQGAFDLAKLDMTVTRCGAQGEKSGHISLVVTQRESFTQKPPNFGGVLLIRGVNLC